MKARFVALSFAALLALPVIACSAADTNPNSGSASDGPDVIDPDGKADGTTKPLGTYDLESPTAIGAADIAFIVLKTDGTVHGMWTPPCKTCMPAQFDGDYKFTKSTTSAKKYIKMDLDTQTVRYEYKMASGNLKLRKVNTTNWFTMAPAEEPWCAAESDCELQGAISPMCVGGWSCTDNACSFHCGTQQNDCESAGGSCVALYPGSCKNGTVGDANTYSCGGQLGVECCLPNEPTQNACESAGGTCVPLVPDACANGTVGDANTYSCGGGLGVECCLPPQPTQNACEAAGGSCVALSPGSCPNGTVGDANTYSCGGGLGVECCLPTPPDDCRTTGCGTGEYCSYCFGHYLCMKDYQVC
jgi:hypothetical protein